MDWVSQRLANSQRRAIGNLQMLAPWLMQPQLGLDVFGNPLPYIDMSKDDAVAQELNRLLAPVPAVAAALGWAAQQQAAQQAQAQAQGEPTPTEQQPLKPPTMPQFESPPKLKDLPLPPKPQLPERPSSLADTLTPYPQLPPFEPPKRDWLDVAAQVVAGLVNPDILPHAVGAFEQAYQQRVQEARDRYERAAANALNAWQAKRQLELADAEAQREYQQQLAQIQNQYQQAQYQAQLANIQAQNEQALREWQARQQYGQWAYEQQQRAYEREEQRRLAEEQKRADRELREELQRNQMGLSMYNSLMAFAEKPALTAAERQTALAAIPALKSVLPQEFHGYLDAVGTGIQAKPSVPEQRLDIDRMKAQAAIRQGWQRIRQGEERLAIARAKIAQGSTKEAWTALKMANTQIEQLRDNIRQIDTVLGRQVQDPNSRHTRYSILGPERERLMAQRNALEQELQRLLKRRDGFESQLLFGRTAVQTRRMTINGKQVEVTVK